MTNEAKLYGTNAANTQEALKKGELRVPKGHVPTVYKPSEQNDIRPVNDGVKYTNSRVLEVLDKALNTTEESIAIPIQSISRYISQLTGKISSLFRMESYLASSRL